MDAPAQRDHVRSRDDLVGNSASPPVRTRCPPRTHGTR
jgi:hypothetical protein